MRRMSLTITTAALQVRIGKKPVRIAFYDRSGTSSERRPSRSKGCPGSAVPVPIRSATHRAPPGQKSASGSQCPPDAPTTDSARKPGPFERAGNSHDHVELRYPRLRLRVPIRCTRRSHSFSAMRTGRAHGIFFDNTYWSLVRHGEGVAGPVLLRRRRRRARLLFFRRPDPARSISHASPNLSAACRCPRSGRSATSSAGGAMRPRAASARSHAASADRQIPCDVIYLDIDYMDGYRVFTWNPAAFPDPRRLVSDSRRRRIPRRSHHRSGHQNRLDVCRVPVRPRRRHFPEVSRRPRLHRRRLARTVRLPGLHLRRRRAGGGEIRWPASSTRAYAAGGTT